MVRPRMLAAALCATALTTAAAPANAAAGKRRQMLRAINDVRSSDVRGSNRLARGATAWARRLFQMGSLQHSGRAAECGEGEIIEWHTGSAANVGGVVREWLNSPGHRKVMLANRYHRAGVGRAVGTMNGRRSTIWVVRFAR